MVRPTRPAILGNFLDGTTPGKAGQFFRKLTPIVLELQAFPDTVDRPPFGCVRLAPGDSYHNTIISKFLKGAKR